jgi:ABC-2 type transport system permease protein
MTTAVAGAERTPGTLAGGAPARRRSPTLAGSWALVRFMLRLDRLRLPVWIAGIALTVLSSASSVKALYPTQADLEAAAEPLYDNAAVIALQGPTYAIDTLGGNIVFNIGGFGYVIVALMAMFLVGRHTRADEEAGRTELLRAAVVGRNAPVTAALVVTGGGLAVTGVLITLSMLALGLPAAGSVAYGAAMAAFGVFFAGVTAVAAQVTEHNRPAYGITGALLGLSFVVRAVGDVGDGTLSWLSPMGWAQSVRPYAGERWWPLGLLLAGAVALVGVAFELLSRRDLGGGLVAARPGPPGASEWLGRPWGLTVRLQRATLLAWAAGLVLTGIAYGSLGEDVADLIGDSEEMADIIAQAGGSLTDSYFATSLLMLAIIAGGYTVSSALRARNEETSGRAEPLLGTALARTTWAGAHLAMAIGGSTLILAATGAAMGGTYGLIVGDAGQVPRLTGAALGFAPSLWVLAGVATALFGLFPRAALAASWAVYAWCALVGFLGQLLDLPQWAMDVSPFEHVPEMPAQGVEWLPLAVLTLVAVALTTVGLTGFRRRDAGY